MVLSDSVDYVSSLVPLPHQVGTDLGVYVTLDRGRTWSSLSATLPTTPVHDLEVHPRDPEIVIGTHGRSVWILDIEEVRARAMR